MNGIIGFMVALSLAVICLVLEAHEVGRIEGYEKGMDDAIKTFEEIINQEAEDNGIDQQRRSNRSA